MPRKTNKTAHVLNLLASGTPSEPEPDTKETESSSLSSNISIMENPTDPADPLAGLIRSTLDKEIMIDSEPEPTPIPVLSQNPPPIASPIEDKPNSPDFVFINMMDTLVQERLDEFLLRFEVCTCERCVQDVKALALTNLPSKYLVLPNGQEAPLTSFYRSKYNIYIVTELTKACLAVINTPRH